MARVKGKRIPAKTVEDEEYQLTHERTCGIDIAKDTADVCVRLPPAREGGRRTSRTESLPATWREITSLGQRLLDDGIQIVVMEATSDYWRAWYYLLGAPRGAVYSCGDGRAPPLGRRSGLVKLEAA